MEQARNKIIPERIREARIARGLSMTELARVLNVSRQAISKYELGLSAIGGEPLGKLINALGFPMSFYTAPTPREQASKSVIHFRSRASSTKKSRVMMSKRAEWLQVIYHYLEQYIDYPEVDVLEIPDQDDNVFSLDEIEEIAGKVRKQWRLGLGPISDVCLLLEKKGFIISRAYLNQQKLDACSYWYDNRPFVFLGSDKDSSSRSRLDLAHELGHLILHLWLDEDLQRDSEIFRRTEKEAFMFAGAFLLPRGSFDKEVFSSSLEHFEILKGRWKVSMAAMITRCEELGILSENQILYLRKQMSTKNYRKREPLDDVLVPEQPSLLSQSIDLLVSESVKSRVEIRDEINLPPDEIVALCNLDKDYFGEDGRIINFDFKNKDRR